MLMAEQVILAIFVISVAFRAEPERKLRIALFRSSANSALVPGNRGRRLYLPLEFLFPVNFLRRNTAVIPRTEKENQEIQHGNQYQDAHNGKSMEKIINKRAYQQYSVKNRQPFHLYWNKEIQQHP